MTEKTTTDFESSDDPWRVRATGLLLVLAALAIYANTFSAPFVFDDKLAIVDNPSIRDLTAWRDVLSPPPGTAGAVGRPLVNLTLALNYALGGLDVRGYHAVNFLIHALATLTLFGLVRRTLLLPPRREKFSASALSLAATVALLWAVHPLATESVTCVIQRNESLASLFILLTLYAFARGIDCHPLNDNRFSSPEGTSAVCHLIDDKWSRRRRAAWFVVAVAANLLGLATKEIVVVAPLLVLLYDRAFVAGSFATAWRRNGRLYAALAAGWLPLAWLVAGAHGRNETAGFGQGVSVLDYTLTQCWAVPHYLALAFWPEPLVVDYGTLVVNSARDVALPALLLAILVVGSSWALVRRPAVGFVAASFFLILAPSSSVLPLVTQTVAEHRMYLPLAAVITLVVLAAYDRLGLRVVFIFLPIAIALGVATMLRNADYRSELALWHDTVAKRPANARAQLNFANALNRSGDATDALAHYAEAVRLQPTFAEAHANFANALLALDRVPEALAHYDEAVRLDPLAADAWHNRGNALARARRFDDAIESYATALRLEPASPEIHRGLANALAQAGRFPEARTHYEIALRAEPESASLHGNLANVLFTLGDLAAARAHYETALRLDPTDADVHNNFGSLLLAQEHPAEALAEFREALRLRPDFPIARANLERAQRILAADASTNHR